MCCSIANNIEWYMSGSAALPLHDLEYVESLELFRWRQGVDYLISPRMIEELRGLDSDLLIAGRHEPVLVVSADEEDRAGLGGRYFEHANEPKELVVIPGADHLFTLNDSLDRLFVETFKWLDEHLRRST